MKSCQKKTPPADFSTITSGLPQGPRYLSDRNVQSETQNKTGGHPPSSRLRHPSPSGREGLQEEREREEQSQEC